MKNLSMDTVAYHKVISNGKPVQASHFCGRQVRHLLLLVLLFACSIAAAQEDAWVYFTDKPDAEFYFANPLEMLSQKALDRRAAQGISLDEKDVPVYQAYIDAIEATPGVTVMARSKWLNSVHVRGTEDQINALLEFDFVANIDFANKLLNAAGRATNVEQTADVEGELGTMANFNYGFAANQVNMLNGYLVHQHDFTGAGMTIAVMDAGFPGVDTTLPFQRLRDNNLILGGHNFVENSENFYTGNQHGTMVLSTMGGYVEGQLVGTAPDAFYYLFVTETKLSENPVEESYWVEAAEMADSLGVDVINTSLAYFIYDNPSYSYSYDDINGETAFVTRGANIAFSRGMICVVSAGNSGATVNPYIGVPGDAYNALTVGAVDPSEQRANFSSIGPTFDGRIKPDVMAQGQSAVIANPEGEITASNGTSFSSPITAGLVACLWQALPDKTNGEILALLKGSADRFNNPDNQYGYGIPNFMLAVNELAIQDISEETFTLYPNPAADVINIALPAGISSANVTLYNSLGQIVFQSQVTTHATHISIEALTKGLYSYKVVHGEKVQAGKLIKK